MGDDLVRGHAVCSGLFDLCIDDQVKEGDVIVYCPEAGTFRRHVTCRTGIPCGIALADQSPPGPVRCLLSDGWATSPEAAGRINENLGRFLAAFPFRKGADPRAAIHREIDRRIAARN